MTARGTKHFGTGGKDLFELAVKENYESMNDAELEAEKKRLLEELEKIKEESGDV